MKTMYISIKRLQLLGVFLLICSGLWAQNKDINFRASVSKNTLGANEKLRIDFSINENGDHFQPPTFEGFQVVMGPSSSSSYNWINGKSSFSKTYTYILAPTRQGKLTIGAAHISLNGKTYTTKPIEIKVTKAVSNPSINKTPDNIASESVFAVTEISNTSPYLNEPVSVVYKIYISPQVGISDLRPTKNPKYQDFWSKNIPLDQYKLEECTYKGQAYNCIVVKRIVLYPQKAGKLTIEPMNVDLVLQVATNRRDFFGRREVREVSKNVVVGKRTLNVKPLPQTGRPDSFSGAVGDFDFKVSLSKDSLKANESLQAKVTISGKGNFQLFDLPKLVFPSSLEVYEPEVSEDVKTNIYGMKGSITSSYTVVPQYKGKFPINPTVFTYFDPKTGKYVTKQSDKLLINVTEGPTSNSARTANNPSQVSQQSIQTSKQFRFLKLNADLEPINKAPFFGSKLYYILLLLPLLFIPIIILIWNIKRRREIDVVGSKIRSANKLAKKYLSAAKKQIGHKEKFYEALERSLHNYLKAKLRIETSEMSKEKITEILKSKSVSPQLIEDFIKSLKNCEMARYSMYNQNDMKNDYDNAAKTLAKMDKLF